MKAPLLLMLVPTLAFAQPKPAAILDNLATTRHVDETAISPDGQRVAWVESIFANGQDTGKTAVYFASLDGKRPRTRLGDGRGIARTSRTSAAAICATCSRVSTPRSKPRRSIRIASGSPDGATAAT